MSLKGLLVEASGMWVNDGDFSLSEDGTVLVARTPDAATAFHAAMENPVFPFTLAHWVKDESLVLSFPASKVERDVIKSSLRSIASKLA